MPLRVDAAGILPNLYAVHTVRPAPVPHSVGHRLIHAAAQQAVVGGSLAEFSQRIGVVQL